MKYKAMLHFPDDPKQCEKINGEIANCRFRYVKTYIQSLDFNSKQAEELESSLRLTSNEKYKQLRKVG